MLGACLNPASHDPPAPGRTRWGYLCCLNQSSFCSSQGQVVVQFLVSQSSPVLAAPSKSHLTCACSTNVLESVNKHTLSVSSLSSHTPSPPVSVRAWEMRDGGNDGHAAFPGRSGTGRYICSPRCNVAQQGTPTCSLVPSPHCPPPSAPTHAGHTKKTWDAGVWKRAGGKFVEESTILGWRCEEIRKRISPEKLTFHRIHRVHAGGHQH